MTRWPPRSWPRSRGARSRSPSAPRSFSPSASWSRATPRRSPRSSPASTARSPRTRRARSPAASRSSSSPAASRTCRRAASRRTCPPAWTATRSGSRSASWPAITPFNFPCHGADVDVPARDRLPATASCSKPSEKDPSASILLDAARGPSCRPARRLACSTSCTAIKVAVDALLTHPDVAAVSFVGSTPDRPLRVRDGHPGGQAGPGARRREEVPHGGAAPTPTSNPGHRRGGLRRVRQRERERVHGDLRACRGGPGLAMSLRRQDQGRAGRQAGRRAWQRRALGDGARSSLGPHRDKVASLPGLRRAAGRERWRSTAARTWSRAGSARRGPGARRLLARAVAARQA